MLVYKEGHMTITNYDKYLAPACEIARGAGDLIMTYFTNGYNHSQKPDNSPVTEADIAANHYIINALAKISPDIPIIAEEDEVLGNENSKIFFLVDPLDGTRSFVRGEKEFTVNIGLIENNQPVLGVIYCPPQKILYFAHKGGNAYKQVGEGKPEMINIRKAPHDGLTIIKSRSHPSKTTEKFLQSLKIKEIIACSGSAKFCAIAEGSADIYPRFGTTMEWDTAAGQAILEAAGGRVETTDGKPFLYGKTGFINNGFIAYGSDDKMTR